jgi:F-type H+-transporting ATPase subunit gamma
MSNIRAIKGRIQSVQNIGKITQAMKVVASARMKKAQERILGARPYAFRLEDVIHDLSVSIDRSLHPLFALHPEGKKALLVVTADRGLCGSFNANVLRKTQAYLKENKDVTLLTVGRKSRDFLKRRGYAVRAEWTNVFPTVSLETVNEITKEIVTLFTQEHYTSVQVVYNEFKNLVQQNLKLENFLPLDPATLRDDRNTSYSGGEFVFEPGVDEILKVLLPKYLATEIRRILLESFSSEMAARRMAMEAASKNASEMIGRLTLEYNRARQAAITKEIAEIVGGAAALQ